MDNKAVYKFCLDSYNGDGGYLTGNYLVPHPKEKSVKNRLKYSSYKNYTKGIVNATITPVFSQEALMETNNDLFEEFINDVDFRGTSLQDFTKKTVTYTRLLGVSFVVMDNVSKVPELRKDAIEQRAFPYIYLVTPNMVVDYTTDKYNNLSSLVFYKDEDTNTQVTDKYFATLDKDGNVIGRKRYHNLGVLPIVSLYNDLSNDILPFPPTYDLCRLNWTIYNQDSEQRVIERNSAFTMLAIDTGGEINDIAIDVGADSVLAYGSRDKTVNKPEWINPDTAILKVMMEASNNTVQKLFEEAATLGVNVYSNSTTSAKHEAYKYIGTSYVVKDTAKLAAIFNYMIAQLFSTWINEAVDIKVKYNDSYLPAEIEVTQKLETYDKLLSLDIDEEAKNKLRSYISDDLTNIYITK